MTETKVSVTEITITGKPENNEIPLSAGVLALGIEYSPAENVEEFSVAWQSNNQAVATVAADGKLTLLSAGRTTVTASVIGNESVKDNFTLTVTDDTERKGVQSITITGRPENDRVGADSAPLQLGYEFTPADADEFFVEWYSSTSSVATIDENGLLTVCGEGSSTVRVTVKGSAVYDEFVLSVGSESVAVTSVSITNKPAENTMRAGASRLLSYTYSPEEATYFQTVWSSSNEEVAAVSQNGEIEALSVGTSVIALTVKGTDISDAFTLTVEEALDPFIEDFENVILSGSSGSGNYKTIQNNYDGVTLSLTDDESEIPANGSGTALKISTETNEYPGANFQPSVLPETGVTYALTFDIRSLQKGATFYVNIYPAGGTSVSANKAIALEEGASGQMYFEFTLAEVTEDFRFQIFAINSGSGALVFTVDNLKIAALPYVSLSELDETIVYLDGGALTLTATTNTGAEILWSSSNENVATVEGGEVTLVGAGEVTIKAYIKVDGEEYSDSVTLRVLESGVNFTSYPSRLALGATGTAVITATENVTGALSVTASPSAAVALTVNGNTVTIAALQTGSVTVTATQGGYNAEFTLTIYDPLKEDFENATVAAGGASGSGIFTFAISNGATLSLTENEDEVPEGAGGKALLVEREGAASFYPGVVLYAGRELTVGAEYTFTVTVRAVSDVTIIYMKLEGSNDGPYNVNTGAITTGQTVTITNTIVVSKANPEILLFVIGAAGSYHKFTVDNVTVTEKAQVVITERPSEDVLDTENASEHQLSYVFVGGASAEQISWSSSNEQVATVDDSGKVTAVSEGTATITLTAGEYACSFLLTVKYPVQGTLIASENFDGNFVVTGSSPFSGTDESNGITFTTNAYQLQLTQNLPENGEGNGLFWNPWDGDGTWSQLNISGVSFESGKTYEIRFDAKLINHGTDLSYIRFCVRVYAADNSYEDIIFAAMGFEEVGETLHYKLTVTVPDDAASVMPFISVQSTSGTQISIDNFAVYEL